MRAWELLRAQISDEPTVDESHPFADRHKEGQAITLRALHTMRKQRDLRELELKAHKQFVRKMYSPPEPPDDKRSPRRKR